MVPVRIGFIGFGEVASVFSKAMREKGAGILIYDILLSRKGGLEAIQRRIQAEGIRTGTLEEVVTNSEYVLSTVTAQAAKDVAKACREYLKPGQVYLDLNSTSPSVKVEVCKIIQPSGADFVEGAVLGAVGATGLRTRILTAGKKGQEVAETLNNLGLNVSHYSPEIGKASMFKMLRSIFSKGLEGLILELLVAGKRAGIEKDLWDNITRLVTENPFDRVASNWVRTHAVAYERRYYEMVQVVETMRGIGVDPLMTSATKAFFKRSFSLGLKGTFPEKPGSFEEVVNFMEKQLGRNLGEE